MPRKKKPRSSPKSPTQGQPEFASRPMQEALRALRAQQRAAEARDAGTDSGPTSDLPPSRPQREAPAAATAGRCASTGAAPMSESDKDALSMAMVGVEPLRAGGPRRVTRSPGADSRTHEVTARAEDVEERARARLDALVSGGVSFRVQREDEVVRGHRADADPRVVRELRRRSRADETLDLHGLHRDEARREVSRFVRRAHRRGLRLLCIVHGKGLHSEGGQGVLGDEVLWALTESGCAPCVLAFCTAPPQLGGSGALLVQLKR